MCDLELRGETASRLALAHRRKDVHLINQSIRTARKSAGDLQEEELFQTVHGPRAFAAGDRIVFTRNDRELGLRNGMLGRVEAVGPNRLVVQIDADDGKEPRKVSLSPKRYDAIDHGYATTIHKSQGATVDHAFVLGTFTMDRHLTYVAMTRHREDVNLYMDRETPRKIERINDMNFNATNKRAQQIHGPRRTR